MTEGILKPGDPCPCCGEPIKTRDPEKLLLLNMMVWLKGGQGRPEPGAAGQG